MKKMFSVLLITTIITTLGNYIYKYAPESYLNIRTFQEKQELFKGVSCLFLLPLFFYTN